MQDTLVSSSLTRWLVALGGLLAATSIAMDAYAAHASIGKASASLHSAAVIGLCHGIALVVLAPRRQGRLGQIALITMLSGALLFSGGILAAHILGIHPRTAPFGGGLLIVAWLLYAAEGLRH